MLNPYNSNFLSPLFGIRFGSWIRFFIKNIQFFNAKYILKGTIVSLVSMILSPFAYWESFRLRQIISAQNICNDGPIFIIGHWRSGTTHLHNLMVSDQRFGYASTLACTFPNNFIFNPFIKWFVRSFTPKRRPMDNMKLDADSPQEDDLALLNIAVQSFYASWVFPKGYKENFNRWVLLPDKPDQKNWKDSYTYFYRKIKYDQGGKTMILKNPAHTARIDLLLSIFPRARFIYIKRDPFRVIPSTIHLYQKAAPPFQMGSFTDLNITDAVFHIYKSLMKAYEQQRGSIPKNQLIEIEYEDLITHPYQIIESIYTKFDLGEWQKMKKSVFKYLQSVQGFKSNVYVHDPQLYKATEELLENVKR